MAISRILQTAIDGSYFLEDLSGNCLITCRRSRLSV